MPEDAFMGIPERWLDDPTWKCENGHISKAFLKSEERGDLCLACQAPVCLCDPNEKERSIELERVEEEVEVVDGELVGERRGLVLDQWMNFDSFTNNFRLSISDEWAHAHSQEVWAELTVILEDLREFVNKHNGIVRYETTRR